MKITGTWEEIASLEPVLRGRTMTVSLPPDEDDEDDGAKQEPPMTWEEWDREGELLRARMAEVWPKGLTALEAVLEQRR